MGVSPPVTVVESGTEFDQPVATPNTLPSSGGSVVISGNTSDPDGTTLHLLLGGADTGVTTTSSGGSYAFPAYTVPANTSFEAETLTFTVST
jgi:hypothetical protein